MKSALRKTPAPRGVSMPSRAPRGVSMIEAMVSLAVFSIGMLGVMQTEILTSQQNGLARRQTAANHIARDLVDAFERVPFSSSMFVSSTLDPSTAAFSDMGNTDGLRLLSDPLPSTERPLLGAAAVISRADGTGGTNLDSVYTVGWRAARDVDSTGLVQGYRVLVMVRFRTPGGGTKQVELWTIKYNPAVVASTGASMEI